MRKLDKVLLIYMQINLQDQTVFQQNFLKCTMEFTVPYLTTVFNSILTTGNIPDDWGKSKICPLHKRVLFMILTILEAYR